MRPSILCLMVLLLAASLTFWTEVRANEPNLAPNSVEGAPVINARDIRPLVVGGALVIDTRSTHDYLAERLPGAIHVVYREYSARRMDFDAAQDGVAEFLTRLHRFADRDAAIVLYCNGPHCWKSYKATKAALADGYRHVFWFRGGLIEWQQAGMDVERE